MSSATFNFLQKFQLSSVILNGYIKIRIFVMIQFNVIMYNINGRQMKPLRPLHINVTLSVNDIMWKFIFQQIDVDLI